MKTLLRTWRTVRHLRPVQIKGQIRRRLLQALPYMPPRPPGSALEASPIASPCLVPETGSNSESSISSGRFVFLNQSRDLGRPPVWQREDLSKLWLYNLHYFDWLWLLDYSRGRDAVDDWIRRYPPGKDKAGWEPYPLTLRLANWALYFYGKYKEDLRMDPAFVRLLAPSLLLQGRMLRKNTEYHLLGNHYFDNGAVLALLGSIFRGPESEKWLRTGEKIMFEQIPEQILPDGTHFELSPMYQCRIAFLLIHLVGYGRSPLAEIAGEALGRTLASLERLTHPDGEIALFNDSAFGIYPPPSALHKSAEILNIALPRSSPGFWALPYAGYYGWKDGSGNYLICDAGPTGPDYIPGHAHGDIFSFELSLAGTRFIVDTGVCGYSPGGLRSYCRSTAAHNTVEIEKTDQSEFWGSFRVGHRARPREVRAAENGNGFSLSGWHDGYRHLSGRPIHRRTFRWQSSPPLLEIEDTIQSSSDVRARSRFHIHPRVSIEREGPETLVLRRGTTAARISFPGCPGVTVGAAPYCPEFSTERSMPVIVAESSGRNIVFKTRVSLL
ncbi:MAG TPA: alginate lyase family protein [bacterium]|nr:alginate lyase family protein [bacterium]HPJ71052.1 alginate lyase family protein [bacterium]HPQ65407.1 alginate lyase family protein [bacterium]